MIKIKKKEMISNSTEGYLRDQLQILICSQTKQKNIQHINNISEIIAALVANANRPRV